MRRSRSIDRQRQHDRQQQRRKIEPERQQREFIPSRLEKCGLGLLLRSLCVCTVCVKINNDEMFFNAFPFENSFYFWIGLDMVRSTGNLSSLTFCSVYAYPCRRACILCACIYMCIVGAFTHLPCVPAHMCKSCALCVHESCAGLMLYV